MQYNQEPKKCCACNGQGITDFREAFEVCIICDGLGYLNPDTDTPMTLVDFIKRYNGTKEKI